MQVRIVNNNLNFIFALNGKGVGLEWFIRLSIHILKPVLPKTEINVHSIKSAYLRCSLQLPLALRGP